MKYILIVVAVITIFMFLAITGQANDCRNNGGKYINTNEGGVCFSQDSLISK